MTTQTTPSTTLIPRQILFGNPERANPQVAPDGTQLAYLAPVDDVLNVFVRTIGRDDDRVVTHDTDRGIRIYLWAEDSAHILYLQDIGGNENWRLHMVDLQGGETRDLTPFDNVQAQIVAHDKHSPDALIVALNKEDARLHDAYRLDLASGELTMVAKNPGNVLEWVADATLQVRGAMAATSDGGFDLLIRDGTDGAWRTARSWDADNSLTSGPVAFSRDGTHILLKDSLDANAGRLVRLDLASGDVDVIAADPHYDVDDVLIHPDTYEVQAVSFMRERVDWTAVDQAVAGDIAAIRAVAGGDPHILNRDSADMTWLLGFTADDGPVSYYAYDRATRQASFLFVNQPSLTDYTLAAMEPFSFAARDGLTVHGYITFPPNTPRQNLPMVLLVHGGPWARDTWGYNPMAQWLANRGYICLQVNFRGSTGYGKEFVNAGDREWGARMQDDLTDAVEWAVVQGYADRDRVAIFGGSYGGYAALAGATFTPDMYRCAVDIVGPSNLITLIETIPPYWSSFLATFHRRVGNPETEPEFLKSRSPLFKVDAITIPILIGQGANDPRVKQAESEQIVAALKNKGLDYEYMLFPDEGHGFAKPENRLRFYAAAEQFLAKHLAGRYEEGADAASSAAR